MDLLSAVFAGIFIGLIGVLIKYKGASWLIAVFNEDLMRKISVM